MAYKVVSRQGGRRWSNETNSGKWQMHQRGTHVSRLDLPSEVLSFFSRFPWEFPGNCHSNVNLKGKLTRIGCHESDMMNVNNTNNTIESEVKGIVVVEQAMTL